MSYKGETVLVCDFGSLYSFDVSVPSLGKR